MKKNLFYAFLLAGAMCMVACGGDDVEDTGKEDKPGTGTEIPVIPDANAVEISNNGFEEAEESNGEWKIKDWTINRNYGPRSANQKASVSIVDGAGRNNTRALKIQQLPSNGKCCVVLERELSGLEPDMMYRMSASLRYSDIPNNEGYGPVLFSPNTKQYWNSSKYYYGTELESWTTTYVDFLSDDNGKAKICIGLGFWQGGAANGGYSTGTVYWDHVTVTKVTTQMYMRESEHMRIWIEPGKMNTSSAVIDEWLSKVDKMYESYAKLMGAVPHEGRKLGIMTTRGMYAGYWALAGYPILWGANGNAQETSFPEIAEGTMSFGLMHELGHVFNHVGSSNWNWNDEMFANFRMQYGLEMNGYSVYQRGANDDKQKIYTGREILDMYKQDYDNTLNNPNGMNDNAVHYVLGRLAGEDCLGWDVFCATFKRLQENGYTGNGNGWYKFENFIETLSICATELKGREIDAWQYINTTERESIKRKWIN